MSLSSLSHCRGHPCEWTFFHGLLLARRGLHLRIYRARAYRAVYGLIKDVPPADHGTRGAAAAAKAESFAVIVSDGHGATTNVSVKVTIVPLGAASTAEDQQRTKSSVRTSLASAARSKRQRRPSSCRSCSGAQAWPGNRTCVLLDVYASARSLRAMFRRRRPPR